MRLDIPFFLGIFYTIFGAVILIGWFISPSWWNFYGLLMMAIGIILVIVRPKPPLRFFVGKVKPEEQVTPKDGKDDMGM